MSNMSTNSSNSSTRNKAKQHPVLAGLRDELRGLRVTKTFVVYGHEYTLGLLSPRDDDWISERAASAGNIFEYATKMAKPKIAAALTAIDGMPVAELFQLPDEPDMTAENRKLLEGNAELRADWLRVQVYNFVCDDMDALVIKELEGKYAELENEKQEALNKLGPLSKRIPSNA